MLFFFFFLDFMTGDNHNQKFLKNVAANLDATSNVSSLHWVAPQVEPNAAIYFFMFTNGNFIWFVCINNLMIREGRTCMDYSFRYYWP